MDPVTIAVLVTIGCGMFLTGCASQKKENDELSFEWQSIPENKHEDEVDKEKIGEPVAEYAEVTCTCGENIEDILYLLADNKKVTMVELAELTEKDIKMTNGGKFKFCTYFNEACTGAEIEDNEWKICDDMSGQGEDKRALNLEDSIMICTKGFGVIYLLSSGQNAGDMEAIRISYLEEIFENWWNGEFYLRETIEPIVDILNRNNRMEIFKSYIISKEQFLNMGFESSQAEDFMMIDMNRVLNKYDITTTERLRHFFSQCFVESGDIVGLPIEADNQAGTYLKSKSYYPYYGVGHIQMTHKYSYQSFAIYVALEKYPELKNNVDYLSPAHNGADDIQTQYDKLKEETKNLGIDISEIVKIVEPPEDAAQYVAENYEWETAGYFWKVGEANKTVDSLVPGDENGVDKITQIVNRWTPTYQERRDAYRYNVKGVIQ